MSVASGKSLQPIFADTWAFALMIVIDTLDLHLFKRIWVITDGWNVVCNFFSDSPIDKIIEAMGNSIKAIFSKVWQSITDSFQRVQQHHCRNTKLPAGRVNIGNQKPPEPLIWLLPALSSAAVY
ncbi:hypothetical protein AB6F62_16650 [Providencia huaxiensis]|uniref:hypothetical protein n=1 Tax=Providencia huaxiensis TaxID=2027290 RepID=UPI0034DCD601